jgi:Lhr-like helicase
MAMPFAAPPRPPAGIAFDVAELVLLRGWAEARGLVMEIALNQVRAGEEYEEVVALSPRRGAPPELTFWRGPEMVVLERAAGRVQRFRFLSEALEHAHLHAAGRV